MRGDGWILENITFFMNVINERSPTISRACRPKAKSVRVAVSLLLSVFASVNSFTIASFFLKQTNLESLCLSKTCGY